MWSNRSLLHRRKIQFRNRQLNLRSKHKVDILHTYRLAQTVIRHRQDKPVGIAFRSSSLSFLKLFFFDHSHVGTSSNQAFASMIFRLVVELWWVLLGHRGGCAWGL